MGVLTEYALRAKLKNARPKELVVEKGTIITPSARQYLQEKNIKLIIEDKMLSVEKIPSVTGKDGTFKKPEFMTSLYGKEFVFKDHPIIELRGNLDTIQAKTLSVQVLAKKLGQDDIVKDLQSILDYERKIMIAEIVQEPLEECKVMGFTFEEIHSMSHNPKKYFGVEHIWYPSYEYGELFAAINEIRVGIRATEIIAMKAFRDKDKEVHRKDIIKALNRLSSYVYVLMCKLLSLNP